MQSFHRFAASCGAGLLAGMHILVSTGLETKCTTSGLREVAVVGGHAGMLSDGEKVYKPILPGRRGRAEVDFYFLTCPPHSRFEDHSKGQVARTPPCRFMPDFHGVAKLINHESKGVAQVQVLVKLADVHKSTQADPHFLVLQDLTKAYEQVCIMDLKLGVQTWDEDAPADKIEREITKYPTQQEVGFRFTGMRVWNEPMNTCKEHGRAFGYKLDKHTLGTAFFEYLHDGHRLRTELIPPFVEKLREIENWFEHQDSKRFYGSSLLFLYDGTADDPKVDVRMIDFAHVWPIPRHEFPGGRDDGYLKGLRSIIAYLSDLQHRAE